MEILATENTEITEEDQLIRDILSYLPPPCS